MIETSNTKETSEWSTHPQNDILNLNQPPFWHDVETKQWNADIDQLDRADTVSKALQCESCALKELITRNLPGADHVNVTFSIVGAEGRGTNQPYPCIGGSCL